jgi:outer membrane protein, heavy metal efflux system
MRWLFLISMLPLYGCASLLAPKDAGFSDVQRVVSERTGKDLSWNRTIEDNGMLSPGVRSLLEGELSADKAVQIALLNNRRLRAKYEDLGVAQADLIQSTLLKNPIFEGALRLHGDEDVFEFGIVQSFMSILTIPLRRSVAKAEFQRAKNLVAGEAMDLAGRTKTAFYHLVAVQQILTMKRTMMEAAEVSYEAARRLHDAGNINNLALFNEQALHEQTKLAVSRAELSVVDAREELNALMGVFGQDTRWEAPRQLPALSDKQEPLADIEARAIESNLDLEAARWRIESTRQHLGTAKVSSLMPDLGGGVEAEREVDGAWFIGPFLELAIPIFDWGQGSRPRAYAELRRAWREYTALAIEIRAAVRTARSRMTTLREQTLYHQKVLVPLSERITRETQLQFNAMQLGVFQLLAAKQREIIVRGQYIESLRDYWIAHTQLAQILNGRLVQAGSGGMPIAGGRMEMTVGSGENH